MARIPIALHWSLLGVLVLSPLAIAKEPALTEGVITDVTVYRGQAMVTRKINVAGPGGLTEIVVTDLPAHVVPSSLYAESTDGVAVRSLTYRERPIDADVRKEVQAINEKLKTLSRQMQANRNELNTLQRQSAYLDQVEQFTASTSTADLNRGVLQPGVVKDMSTYLFEQRKRIADRSFELDQAHQDLNAQVELANRERNQITGTSSRTAREAVLYLDVTDAKGGTVAVNYLVNNANWTPSYTARLDSDAGKLQLEYLASVEQLSGEAWNDVRMTLSTATPSLTARAPKLDQFTLSLEQMTQQAMQQMQADEFAANYKQLQNRKIVADNFRNNAPAPQAGAAVPLSTTTADSRVSLPWQRGQQPEKDVLAVFDKELNDIACSIQLLEYGQSDELSKAIVANKQVTESLSVSYQLPSRITLTSRNGQQLLTVRALDLDAQPYLIATPVLTDFVYEEAATRNASDIVLLAGPIASYLDGQFVGRGELPSIAAGEQFTIGFGADSSLRASRQLVKSDEQIQGGNRVVEILYRLTVENFNGGDMPVRVFDRIPTADEKKIKISLVATNENISDEQTYLDTLRKKGILRWDLTVPAGSSGAGSTTVEYTLRLEYDKQMNLADIATGADAQPAS